MDTTPSSSGSHSLGPRLSILSLSIHLLMILPISLQGWSLTSATPEAPSTVYGDNQRNDPGESMYSEARTPRHPSF